MSYSFTLYYPLSLYTFTRLNINMVNFERESKKIEEWQRVQAWEVKDPFTHLTSAELFTGFDELLKKLFVFVGLEKNYGVIYGHYGFGKTTLIKKAASDFSKKYNVILFEDAPDIQRISNKLNSIASSSFLNKILNKKINAHDYVSFNKRIKKHTVLIFDEAHSISDSVFSYIRNLTESGKSFSILLAGKPELMNRDGGLPQYLIDRLEFSEGLRPLTEKEAISLIKKRVEVLAKSKAYLFTDEAIIEIAKRSRFVPRDLLENCSKFLEYAINENKHEITLKDVKDKFNYVAKEAALPDYSFEKKDFKKGESGSVGEIKKEGFKEKKVFSSIDDEEEYWKKPTYERMMEGLVPKPVPGIEYNIMKEEFLDELSPLQKRIISYLFNEEPKSAQEIAKAVDNSYDTVRHMLKRLQGKYNEPESKKKIKGMYPLVETRKNPKKRGYIFFLSKQTRKVMSKD